MIKFSVVTVTYNAAAVLQRTLDSVSSQSHPNVEHLIIDGASTDSTLDMALAYKASNAAHAPHRDVVVLSGLDHGIYDAMNKGLAHVCGDYVVFLNAGDFFPSPDTLSQIALRCRLDVLPSCELPAVVYGQTDIVDSEGRYLHPRRLQPPERLTWRSFLHGMLVCHQAFYARADVARSVRYDTRYRYSADVDWCIRVMLEAERRRLPLANAHLTVACYTSEGATTRHHFKSLLERYRVMSRHYGHAATLLMHCWFAVRTLPPFRP